MDLEKAKHMLASIQEALSTVLLDNQVKENKLKKLQPLENENKTLRRENANLKERIEKLILLANYAPVEICTNCNGDGGFSYDTPEGTRGEQCPICEGSGVIEKQTSTIN